jgi:hypothetical protein
VPDASYDHYLDIKAGIEVRWIMLMHRCVIDGRMKQWRRMYESERPALIAPGDNELWWETVGGQ